MPENKVSTTGGAEVETTERAVSDAKHNGEQKLLLDKIGATWKRGESDRIIEWYILARLIFDYVCADLVHNGNGAKVYSAAVGKVVAYLSDFTDEAKASVSRLLATQGLYNLMTEGYLELGDTPEEADALCKENMQGLTVSLLKSLVRLVERDEEAPDLRYVWKEEALGKGFDLVSNVFGEGYTVAKTRDAVDALFATTDTDGEEDDKAKVRKAAAEKGSTGIASALKKAGTNGARKDTIRRAVKTEALTTDDIATMIGQLGADELDKVVSSLGTKTLHALYKSCKERAAKLKEQAGATTETAGAAA